MTQSNNSKKPPQLPQKDAVKQLRDRFNKRKSEIRPSSEMEEIIKKNPTRKDEPQRKIARPRRRSDLDLA